MLRTLLLLTALLSAVPAPAQAQTPPASDFVVTTRDAYLISDPELAARGTVRISRWSDSGRFVLSLRQEFDAAAALQGRPTGASFLTLWDRSRGARDVSKPSAPGTGVREFEWLARSEVALVLVDLAAPRLPGAAPQPPQRWVLRLDARAGVTRPLVRVDESARLYPAPGRPLALISSVQSPKLLLVTAAGAVRELSRSFEERLLFPVQWTGEGDFLMYLREEAPAGERRRATPYLLDAEHGRIRALLGKDELLRASAPAPTPPPECSACGKPRPCCGREQRCEKLIRSGWKPPR